MKWFAVICRLLVLAAGLSVPVQTHAQSVYYVRAGASGANNGSDWNNAFTSLPATLQRGATYYIADGSYGSYLFDDAQSGTTYIYIKKAIEQDHGTDTGWQTSYGDGQVVFGTLTFATGYYDINGKVGYGAPWWNSYTRYGFLVNVNDGKGLRHQDFNPRDNIRVSFMEINCNGTSTGGSDGIYFVGGGLNCEFRNMYVHHLARVPFYVGSGTGEAIEVDNWLFERIFTSDYNINQPSHAEVMAARRTGKCIVRYCVFKDIRSTGGLIIGRGNGWEIYGNVFFWSTDLGGTANNGAIGSWSSSSGYSVKNFKIYNNTFYNLGNGAKRLFPIANDSSGHVAHNNLWVNCSGSSGIFSGSVAHSHNAFFGTQGAGSDNQIQVLSSNPLMNSSIGDFRLILPTEPGIVLPAPINVDPLGMVRGIDGTWDRGAFEYGGVPDTTPPVISNVNLASVSSKSAVVTWTTDEAASSTVVYGTTTAYGFTNSSPSLVLAHSVILANLAADTVYNYRVRSTDPAGNTATSGNMTFRTAVPDTTAPTAVLLSPTEGATISGTIVLIASALDNLGGSGVAAVEFFVDGKSVGYGQGTPSPYELVWPSWTVSNGLHSISARAFDRDGNQGDSPIVTVTVENASTGAGDTLRDGLLVHLPFNGYLFDEIQGRTAFDASTNRNDAALFNGVARVSGQHLSCFSFDGVNDYVRVPTSPSMESSTNAVTVGAWVRVQQNGQWQAIARKILQEGSHVFPYAAYDMIVEESGGSPRARLSVSRTDGTRGVVYSTPITYGAWYHLVGTYDGTALKIFVNGAEVGSAPFTGQIVKTGQALLIARNAIGGDIFKGLIDEFRVYNRALSNQEVQTLYAAAAPSALEDFFLD